MNQHYTFKAPLWLYQGEGAWCFLTLPEELARQIKFFHASTKAFRSVRVADTIGVSQWKTSLFADSKSGSFLLPVKAAIRKAENLALGDLVSVSLDVLG